MDVFGFKDYKKLTLAWIETQPKNGYGQLRKMAQHLGVGSVLISQIFKGDRELTGDQALALTKYMAFMNLEQEYFLLLVQQARAAGHELRDYLQTKLDAVRTSSKNLKKRIDTDRELTETEQARFYSDWHYSGIRNLTAVPGYDTPLKIAERLSLPLATVQDAIDFLLQSGLCVSNAGKIANGPKLTHLEAGSPLIKTRQIHWRMKAVETMNRADKEALFYTCPMSMSAESRHLIREKLLAAIQEVIKEVKDSPSEDVACLNIDWFRY